MDSSTPLDSELFSSEEQQGRPQFLTLLCILTYIGVGSGVISSIVVWWGMDSIASTNLPSASASNSAAVMNFATTILILSIIGCILCLFGALQMWRLKKLGFYIYVIGEIGPAIASIIMLKEFAWAKASLFTLIVPIIFIALYGTNLRHLK